MKYTFNPDLKWITEQSGLTKREWKSRKRKELRAVIKACDVYRIGCFYTPGGNNEFEIIEEQLKSLKQNLSVKNWGN